MSEPKSECRCGRETKDGEYVCRECIGQLEKALAECPWMDDELDTTITRQKAAAISGGSPGAEKGLPWHERAANAQRSLHSLLVLWVRFCAEESVRGAPADFPDDNIPALSRWMMQCLHGLTLHEIGPDAVDEITDAVADCRRIVFWKKASRLYLGTCGQVVTDEDGEVVILSCPGEVYAEEGEPVGECDECKQGVTVVIRKGEIDKRLHDRLCTPAEIATYAVYLGLSAPREQVRRRVNYWHRHKRIEHKGDNPRGEPLFQYGEVRKLLYAEFGRESA